MSKKINKHLRKELAQAKANISRLQGEKSNAEAEAKYYKKRLRDLGSEMETMEESPGNRLVVQTWTLDVLPFGTYCCIDDCDRYDGGDEIAQQHLVMQIAESLIKNNLVQFIYKKDPFDRKMTLGAKLFIVPWEQTPHPRALKIQQFVNDSFYTAQKQTEPPKEET